ncbi:putative transcriptional regulatory protein NarL [compost metagenome]
MVKGVETKKILATIQVCLDGGITYPLSIQPRLVQALRTSQVQKLEVKQLNLSVQERNILKSLKLGKSNQAIASELFLTTGTVKNYLSAIYKKLNVAGRSETIAYLHEHDL